ncbi:MAG: STAS domain-containing protein [Candidatus Wallbacteria bacterium]|nr:STAS domain-containing protein [Candidatus Wallbacteria bacterium]
MESLLGIEVVDRNNVKLIRVNGNIGTENSADFREKLLGAIEDGISQIVLDVERMNYINSMGIGAMVDAYNRVKQTDGALALVNPSKELAQLLKILRLDKLFKYVATYDEALEYFLKRKLL